MSDSLDLQSQIQYLKSLPQYSGMTDDMIEQMIFQEMPQQSESLTSGDFGMPIDNQIDYGYNTQYPSMTQSDFEIQQQSQKFDLGNTVGNLQNIYKKIGGKEGIAKAKDFLGLSKNTMGLEMTNALPTNVLPSSTMSVATGTSGLSSVLAKIGLKGQAAATSAGTGGSLISALGPAAIMVGAGLLLRNRGRKRAEKRRMKKEKQYQEATGAMRDEKMEAQQDYMKMASQYQNPYNYGE